MKIYLASRFSRADEMNLYAYALQRAGHEIVSRWHADPDHRREWKGPDNAPAELNARLAREDWEDLSSADAVVSFTGGGGRGGRHVEFGMAITLGKRIIIVGPRENVFHWLPQVSAYPDFFSCVAALSAIPETFPLGSRLAPALGARR